MGHIYIEGPPIDRLGLEPQPQVSENLRAARIARDGVHFHITLLHGGLVEQLRVNPPPCLVDAAAASDISGSPAAAGAAPAAGTSAAAPAIGGNPYAALNSPFPVSRAPSSSAAASSSSAASPARAFEQQLVHFFVS